MKITRIPRGMFGSNCYIVSNDGEGVVIDAGAPAELIAHEVEKENLKIKYVILTHGHLDHICCADDICRATGARLAIHADDAQALSDPELNGSELFGDPFTQKAAEIVLKDGDSLEAGGIRFEVLHTPGHTPGGICIKAGGSLFTGDTLFRLSIGRTDLPLGDYDQLICSLKDRLMKLDDGTDVFPGHEAPTTIGFERVKNPFLRG